MSNTMKQLICHLVLIIFEKSFQYLHRYFDIVYDIDHDEIDFVDKEV